MPVTAKLSRTFYERFGDEIANEFVDWFNSVDSTYQAQVREINEANRAWMDARFAEFDARIAALDARMGVFEARMDAKLAKFRTEMILWMFLFWTGTVVPLAGLELALHGVFSK